MFYDRLSALCAEQGISVNKLLEKLGVNPSIASRWKSKGYKPSNPIAKKIADYFGITVKELMSEQIKESPDKESELNIPEDLKNLALAFHRGGIENLTQEEINKLVEIAKVLKPEIERKNQM